MIVEAAVEATGARRRAPRRRRRHDRRDRRPGRRAASGSSSPLTAGRTTFGTLTLVGESFDDEQRLTASSLASHAAIALENARLHRIVERQALVDGLTGIANRRQCEDALTRRDRARRAARLAADARPRRPRRLQGGQRPPRARRRRRRPPRVRRASCAATVRDSDLAGRWGGEEFLLLLPGSRRRRAARQLAERVREAFAERSFLGRDGEVVSVTCSFGVAQHRPGEGAAGALRAPPTGPSTGPSGQARTGSRSKQPVRSF